MNKIFPLLMIAGFLIFSCKKEDEEVKIPIDISATVQSVTVFGASDGTISLTVTGGKASYEFNWSNGATTQNITALSVGTYSVTVSDANGDTATHSETITEPTELLVTYVTKNEKAVGKRDGNITLTISGGIPPYSVLWSNSATTEVIDSIPAGIYSVTVTDHNNAVKKLDIQIFAPLKLTVTATDVTSMGGADATADLMVEGGVAPFTYNWSDGSTQEDLSGLPAGYYEVTVTDADSKTKKSNITVYEPYQKGTPASDILSHVDRLKQSGMRIEYGGKVIYIDPINLYPGKSADADIILVTHIHDDHYNQSVISQLLKGTTTVLVTSDVYSSMTISRGTNTFLKVAPDSVKTVNGISIEVVPAYNIVRSLHVAATSVGYILNFGSTRFYHSGDTELIPEMSLFNVDIACIPMGQTYTFLTIDQAVQAAISTGASVVMPMHYGNAEGTLKDPWTFKEMVNGTMEVVIRKPNL